MVLLCKFRQSLYHSHSSHVNRSPSGYDAVAWAENSQSETEKSRLRAPPTRDDKLLPKRQFYQNDGFLSLYDGGTRFVRGHKDRLFNSGVVGVWRADLNHISSSGVGMASNPMPIFVSHVLHEV
jgi:hypothetical protein